MVVSTPGCRVISLSDEFAKKTPTSTLAPIQRGTAAHVPIDRVIPEAVSRNIVHNPSICLHSVSLPKVVGKSCLHYFPEHVQEVAQCQDELETGTCHYEQVHIPSWMSKSNRAANRVSDISHLKTSQSEQ